MTKPYVFTEDGYWYMTCRVHDTDDEPHIGVASHVAAMNNAAIHYHIRHHRKRRP